MNLEKKAIILGVVWGVMSIFGAISGMVHVSGMQRSVTGSWTLDAIIFLPAFLAWQLTKILPETFITGLFVLFSPILIGATLGYGFSKVYLKFKK